MHCQALLAIVRENVVWPGMEKKRGLTNVRPNLLAMDPGKAAVMMRVNNCYAVLAERLTDAGRPISRQAVSKWTQIPADWLLDIERVFGVPRHVLRADLFEGYVQSEPEQSRHRAA